MTAAALVVGSLPPDLARSMCASAFAGSKGVGDEPSTDLPAVSIVLRTGDCVGREEIREQRRREALYSWLEELAEAGVSRGSEGRKHCQLLWKGGV